MYEPPVGIGTLPEGMCRRQGKVVDAAGKGLGKAIVTLSLGTGSCSIMTAYEGQAAGNWYLMGMADGTYQVTAELAGYAPAISTVVLVAHDRLPPCITVMQRL